jgi:DNA-binding HxlR family transcriptional regulator
MAGKRSYGDRCGIARALDLVGERWALLVVRELLLGPKRFTDLRAGLAHVSPDVLAQRLRELEQADVVRRAKLPPPAGSRVYELTERGKALEPIVLELGRWGSVAPFPPGRAELGADALAIALKSLFAAPAGGAAGKATGTAPGPAAGTAEETFELRLGEDRFSARVADGAFELTRGTAAAPDAIIDTDPATLATVLWHGRELAEAQRSGDLSIEGNRRAAARFLRLFPLPG